MRKVIEWFKEAGDWKSFAIQTKRSDKNFLMKSKKPPLECGTPKIIPMAMLMKNLK